MGIKQRLMFQFGRLFPTLLAKVAIGQDWDDWDVREAATAKLTDQALLAKVAIEAKDGRVRGAVVEKLTDQVLLAKIAFEAEYWDARRPAVEKLTDQALLAKITLEAKDSDIRRTAVKKLTDQAVLAKIAVEDKDVDVRQAAVEKLENQAVLAKIATEDQYVRFWAVKKLTDQALLAKFALEDKDWEVRKAAVKPLTDQALLAKVAIEAKHWCVRRSAVEKLTDQALLAKVAMEAKHSDVRVMALCDESALSELENAAKTAVWDVVRETLTDLIIKLKLSGEKKISNKRVLFALRDVEHTTMIGEVHIAVTDLMAKIMKVGIYSPDTSTDDDPRAVFLATNSNTSPEILDRLALSSNMAVVVAVARNPSTSADTLRAINNRFCIEGAEMYWNFVHNPNCPRDILQEIVSQCRNDITTDMAIKHPNFNKL